MRSKVKMVKSKRSSLLFVILGILLPLFLVVNVTDDVSAATTPAYATTMRKATFQGLWRCYKKGAITNSFKPMSKYSGVGSLLTKVATTKKTVPLVTGYKDSNYNVSANGMNCTELLKGGSTNNKGIFKANGKSNPPGESSTQETREKFLTNMGFTVALKAGAGDGGACYRLQYKVTGSDKTNYTNQVCTDGKKLYTSAKTSSITSGVGLRVAKKNERGQKELVKSVSSAPAYVCIIFPSGEAVSGAGKCKKVSNFSSFNAGTLNQLVQSACGGMQCEGRINDGSEHGKDRKKVYTFDSSEAAANLSHKSSEDYDATWTDYQAAARTALGYLSDNKYNTLGGVKVGDLEKRLLYQYYLTKVYRVEVNCKEGQSDSAFDGKIAWFDTDSKTMKSCHYEDSKAKDKNKNKKVNGIENGLFKYESIDSYSAMKSAFKDLKKEYSEAEINDVMENVVAGGTNTDGENGEDGGDSNTDKCYESSGKLGWIICPIIKGASEAGEFLWDKVQGILNVPANEVFAGDSGVRTAWGAIRDIANVIFVVLFLMVIFSQLTGVGIDNYGIKKILPKLIVAAILINLSYVICELVIDISNILGNSLESLLADPAKDIEYDNTKIAAAGLISTALGGGGAVLYTLLGAGAATGGLGIVALGLAVLGIVIAIVAAIIFIYLILVIRQAGVILLVVLAPAAIVCYMLPNTEKIFKRWLDIFKALLLVYPICGALIGAGQLGGAILASVGSGEMIVAAMIVTVAPFFLVPILLKNSLSLLGNLGAKLQNTTSRIGRGFSNASSSAIKNTEGVKNSMKLAGEERSARWAQRTVNRLGGRSNLSGRNQHRLLDAQKALNARTLSNAEAEVGAYALDSDIALGRATSAKEAQEFRAYQDQFAGFSRDQLIAQANSASGANGWLSQAGGQQRMSALIGAMESRGMEDKVYGMLQQNDVGKMSGVMQTLANSNNKVLKAYGKTGGGVSYNDFMAGTMYRDGNGNITNQAIDANGRANTSVSMQRYAEQKGGEFVNGLDDKALAEISRVDNGGMGPQIMSTGQLTQAAANLNDEASMNSINAMLGSRQDIGNAISADQLTKFNVSTLNDLEARAHNDVALKNAILQASNTIASDPKMAGSMSAANKTIVNNIRGTRNLPPIP